MRDFKQLKVWEKSHQLTLEIYKLTAKYSKEEIYGLVSQMRRSSSSIPTNIAEGCGRSGDVEFARFLQIAFGSACELEYQLLLSYDIGYINQKLYDMSLALLIEIKKMLMTLIKKLKAES